MAKVLTPQQTVKIKEAIYEKADAFGYASSGRNDSGRFMDELVEDPCVGGVLKQYMSKERVRTYIKDGVLNAYKKELTRKALETTTPTDTIQQVFGVQSSVIQKCSGKNVTVSVSRDINGRIIVVSGGTALKWETALRKALEIIARQPGLTINSIKPSICLHLVTASHDLTEGDKKHITDALSAIAVKAIFSNE